MCMLRGRTPKKSSIRHFGTSRNSRGNIPNYYSRARPWFKYMTNPFFEKPILNSPYACPSRFWELDESGQPTQRIIEARRRAEFITPIPKPKKRKGTAADQQQIVFDEGKGLSSTAQQYDPTSVINELRQLV